MIKVVFDKKLSYFEKKTRAISENKFIARKLDPPIKRIYFDIIEERRELLISQFITKLWQRSFVFLYNRLMNFDLPYVNTTFTNSVISDYWRQDPNHSIFDFIMNEDFDFNDDENSDQNYFQNDLFQESDSGTIYQDHQNYDSQQVKISITSFNNEIITYRIKMSIKNTLQRRLAMNLVDGIFL